MPWGAVFGLLACFLISFVLVGAAFFAWWTNFTQIKALPDVDGKVAPLLARVEALEVRITQLSETPAALRKRIDEAEESSKWASKKIETFTGQVGVLQKMVKRLSQESGEKEPDSGTPTQNFSDLGGIPLFDRQDETQPKGSGFGKTMRKAG